MSEDFTYWIAIAWFGALVVVVVMLATIVAKKLIHGGWDAVLGPRPEEAPRARLAYVIRPFDANDENARRLLAACSDDRVLLERLVQNERERLPHLSYNDALQAALERMIRDRH